MIKLNGIEIKPTMFPDKTSQVWKLPTEIINAEAYNIEWFFECEAELIHLTQLRCLLYRVATIKKTTLYIDYLPYARQDKMVENDLCFAIYPMVRILSLYPYDEINVLDPHSNFIFSMGKKVKGIYLTEYVNDIYKDVKADVICYPDKGAYNKYVSLYTSIPYHPLPYIYAEKERDQSTGTITNHRLVGDAKDKIVLICDDLCDYGNTFISLSKLLYDAGAKEVHLFVTHGLFSGGLDHIRESNIKRIFSKKGEHIK